MKKILICLSLCLGTANCLMASNSYQMSANETHGFVEKLTDKNFAEKTNSGIAIVDFYADWCPPCQRLGPVYNKVAEAKQHSIKFCKINIDDAGKTSSKFEIRSLPTLIILKNGKEIKRHVGGATEEQLRSFIQEYSVR